MAIYKRNELFAIWELKERGWTKTMIEKLMPEHDDERDNPHYKCAASMKFYKKRRVYGYERGSRWKDMHQKSLTRIQAGKKSAAKSAETRKANKEKLKARELAYLENYQLDIVTDVAPDDLEIQAIQHYNDNIRLSRDYWHPEATRKSDKDFLARITVNYVRHCLTNYDEARFEQYHELSNDEVTSTLKEKVLDLIAETYPHLEVECDNQWSRQYSPSHWVN